VIVTGSRDWTDRGRIADRLALLPGEDDTVVVHGAARGVDRIAGEEAMKLGLLVEPHPVTNEEWKFSRQAGFKRNERMAQIGADLCIAFWDGRSHGTLDMITRAVKHGIPVDVVMQR
jgi:hypothetical protein